MRDKTWLLWLAWRSQLQQVQISQFFLTIIWKNLTTKGAYYGGMIGLLTTITLVILGPTIWVEVFGFKEAIFPHKYPAIFTVSISFLAIFVISIMDKTTKQTENHKKFEKLTRKAYLGE